jgi:hypothetical protein
VAGSYEHGNESPKILKTFLMTAVVGISRNIQLCVITVVQKNCDMR